MNINSKNQIIIDTINAITEGTPENYLLSLSLLCIREGHFDISKIKIFEGIAVLKQLTIDGYIQKLNKDEVNQILKQFFLSIEQDRQKKIDDGIMTVEDVLEEGKRLLKEKQIDIDTAIPKTLEEAENTEITIELIEEVILKNRTDIPKETINKIIFSDSVGYYFIIKNPIALREILENGHDYYSLDHTLPLETTKFDSEKSILLIRGFAPIQIQKQSAGETREHAILKYLFSSPDINVKIPYSNLDDEQVYGGGYQDEKYYAMCRDVNKKVREGTQGIIEQFLDCNEYTVRINPEYL